MSLRAVLRGETYVHSSLTHAVWAEASSAGLGGTASAEHFALLSKREQEVFQWLVRGYSNQEAADRLCISVKTVETHRSHLLEKLGLHSRADLVRYALAHALLTAKEPSR